MKVESITLPPKPLEIGEGAEGFKLLLKRFTGTERLACIDAFASGSFEMMQRAVGRLVRGWENVVDEDGRVIPFESEQDGRKGNNFDALMGAMELQRQGDVIGAVYAFIGVAEAGGAIRRSTGSELDPRPTAPPASSTPGTASGG